MPSRFKVLFAAAVLALAVVSTALAYIVFFRISATAGPSNVMLVTLLTALAGRFVGARSGLRRS